MSSISASPVSSPATATPKAILDQWGMVLSTACAVHCVAMPFGIGLLAYFGQSWVASEQTELLLMGSAFLVAIGSLVPSYLKHRNPSALLLFAAGFAVISSIHLAGHSHTVLVGALLASGGSLIAVAHYRNHRLCQCCRVHSHSH